MTATRRVPRGSAADAAATLLRHARTPAGASAGPGCTKPAPADTAPLRRTSSSRCELDLDDLGHGDDPVALLGQRLASFVGHEGLDRLLGGELKGLDLQRLVLQGVGAGAGVPGPLDDLAAVL